MKYVFQTLLPLRRDPDRHSGDVHPLQHPQACPQPRRVSAPASAAPGRWGPLWLPGKSSPRIHVMIIIVKTNFMSM